MGILFIIPFDHDYGIRAISNRSSSGVQAIDKAVLMIPTWSVRHDQLVPELEAAGFSILFEQEVMALPLSASHNVETQRLRFQRVNNEQTRRLWIENSSAAFNYSIDEAPIKAVMDVPTCYMWLVYDGDEAIGSLMMLAERGIAGFHSLGVPQEHRRKGYAREIMVMALREAILLGCEYAVLQASDMGLSLYQELGFQSQLRLRNYCRGPFSI